MEREMVSTDDFWDDLLTQQNYLVLERVETPLHGRVTVAGRRAVSPQTERDEEKDKGLTWRVLVTFLVTGVKFLTETTYWRILRIGFKVPGDLNPLLRRRKKAQYGRIQDSVILHSTNNQEEETQAPLPVEHLLAHSCHFMEVKLFYHHIHDNRT